MDHNEWNVCINEINKKTGRTLQRLKLSQNNSANKFGYIRALEEKLLSLDPNVNLEEVKEAGKIFLDKINSIPTGYDDHARIWVPIARILDLGNGDKKRGEDIYYEYMDCYDGGLDIHCVDQVYNFHTKKYES